MILAEQADPLLWEFLKESSSVIVVFWVDLTQCVVFPFQIDRCVEIHAPSENRFLHESFSVVSFSCQEAYSWVNLVPLCGSLMMCQSAVVWAIVADCAPVSRVEALVDGAFGFSSFMFHVHVEHNAT